MSPQRSVSSENLSNRGNSISYSHSVQSRAGRAVIKLLENASSWYGSKYLKCFTLVKHFDVLQLCFPLGHRRKSDATPQRTLCRSLNNLHRGYLSAF